MTEEIEYKNKRGLVIVYDPHTLQQFLWYYYTYGKKKQWDALCLPNGQNGTYMVMYCERTEVFGKVLKGDIDYLALPLEKKACLFIEMVAYYIAGKQKSFAKKVLNSYVGNIDDYDEIISICETGFVTGLAALLGQEKRVSFLDDGLGEYNPRTKWSNTYKVTSFVYWQSWILMKMGYACKGRFYFEPTKYCYKYSVITSEMKYLNYKKMYDFDMTYTDISGYTAALNKAYPELLSIDFNKVEAVFFTDDMDVFSDNYQEYYDKCSDYISNSCNSVLLKKHPKDMANYKFHDDTYILEIGMAVPAEIILPYIKGKKIYFTMFSSLIIFMKQYNYNFYIFYSQKFYNENLLQRKNNWKFHSRGEMRNLCERFSKGYYNIIDIE